MRGACLLTVFLLSSCYTYRPLATPEPAAGAAVQVALTDEGTRQLAAEVGPDVVMIHGKVLGADSGDLNLSVTSVENSRREPLSWNGERLELPRAYVRQIEDRQISPGGTGILGGAIAAGLVAAYRVIGGQSTAQGSMGEPGNHPH